MIQLIEGAFAFDFSDDWLVTKYDEWDFYVNAFQSVCPGTLAVDFAAISPSGELWLIEVKDYRVHQRAKQTEVADEVMAKVRDSLAGIFTARPNANGEEQEFALQALECETIRISLHLEPPSVLTPAQRSMSPARN